MEMGRGDVGAATMQVSPAVVVVGGEVVTLGTQINQKENKTVSDAQQESKDSQTPLLSRERKLDSMLNDLANSGFEDLSDEQDVPFRYVRIKSEENG
ncbi:uncharacterized protein MONOS_13291 [Monocercomonoides exilis]|uniref:uncharacterized protein n=1 Tax=Monocercomonoides exilis TaxID=2049356 RepID=UPI00355A70CF|nr:hypothetical protein MONOS_13291 [Monocercomonoides exilis]|eukprot:MONOS_13291.1-p1 / transcript=MONOS_13291.1 / gene=MONOS_13291 / organism=Monocercomonoides_exilis_PA203 / gene_product=unspecified product / transcript_product=unspecified product / location=Mono_scaffold00804:18384-18955(-) / protein_length=97 / sequence_SO=supercontig / SO=protein_coding / is_pseudo=false